MGGEAKLLLMYFCVGWVLGRVFVFFFSPLVEKTRCTMDEMWFAIAAFGRCGLSLRYQWRNLLDVQRYYIGLLTVSALPANLGRWCLEDYVDVTLG